MNDILAPLEAAVTAFQNGRFGEAEDFLRQVLAVEPDDPDALHLLGLIAVQGGELETAADHLQRAYDGANGHPAIAVNLAAVLGRLGRYAEQADMCRKALQLVPEDPGLWNGLGLALQGLGDGRGAQASFAKAAELAPDEREPVLNLAAALYRNGDAPAAARVYSQVLDRRPEDTDAAVGLGLAQAAAGRTDAALSTFRHLLLVEPSNVEALFNLAAAGAMRGDEEAIAMAALSGSRLDASDRARLHFAMAEHLAARDAEQSLRHAAEGNRLRLAQWAAQGHVFDPDAFDAYVDGLIETFDADWFAERKGKGAETERPVFIVGLPRTGSTLLERILAAHPEGAAGGEMGVIHPLNGLARAARNMDGDDLLAIAAAHEARMAAVSKTALRVSDKTPFNYLCLGVIAAAMANAKLVHVRRNALAVGLSCFLQDFQEPHPWAAQLGTVGRYIRAHDRLMEHWRAVLPSPMLSVEYEDLTADTEAEVRRFLDFVGLPFDAACLSPENAGGSVRTASVWAVRRKVNAGAVDKWKAYDRWLGPMRDGLDGKDVRAS